MIDVPPPSAMEKGTLGSPFFRPAFDGVFGLRGFDDLVAPNAPGADPNSLGGAINQNANRLEVRHPATLPPIVGMTNVVASRGAFGANRADTCHIGISPLVMLVVDQAVKFSLGPQMAQGKSCRGH